MFSARRISKRTPFFICICCVLRDVLRKSRISIVDMSLKAFCQPINVDPATAVYAERVTDPASSNEFGEFAHFHDVAEFIWFRKVEGELFTDSDRFDLSNNMAVFVPSMQYHDFRYSATDKEWILVHIDPQIVESLVKLRGMSTLTRPICEAVGPRRAARFSTLCDWLAEEEAAPHSLSVKAQIAELVLAIVADAVSDQPVQSESVKTDVDRLRPALEMVSGDPAGNLLMSDAAAQCNMSPGYFSRRFKQVIGMNFSEYVLLYRLRLAARSLATTDIRIGELAYQLGFSSPAHFTSAFKTRVDASPREYRQGLRFGRIMKNLSNRRARCSGGTP